MSESLREKQSRFAFAVSKLIQKAYELGYEITLGEALRSKEQAALNAKSGAGISNSLHTDKLAIDINLYKKGIWLQNSEDHKPLGDYWKSLGVDYRWGGDFKPRPDGNHYSIEYNGRK